MRPRLLYLAAALALLGAACNRRGAVDSKAPIIIISIDTLRSDHLPAYGYTKVDTPAIDAFRKDSILYERAYSHCPLTLVSHATVFTGTLPAEHGLRDNLGYTMNPKSHTLAELLKSKGYATGGAVSAVALRGETGISRGFDFWEESIDLDPSFLSIGRAQRSGDATRELAQDWIGKHKSKPFFFFFHIYEPHTPYEPVEPFKSRYAGRPYDGEIATADAIIGRFIDYLKSEKLYDGATIVLMSDHGEGLGDHGENEHGILLYRETLQVPLMLKLPKEREKGTTVAAPVQLIDVFPTIAAAFGVTRSEGRSLLEVAHGNVKDERAIYSETYYPRLHFGWNDLHSLISGSNHYIQGPKPELYDVVKDPQENVNVLTENRRTYVALRDRIQPFIHAVSAPSAVDDEQKQQLIALGYVGSTVNTAADEVLPNPRDNIAKANEIYRAFREFKESHFDVTIELTNKLLHENPNMADIWSLQTQVFEKQNRPEEAIAAAKQGLRVAPTSSYLALTVARLSLQLGRLDDAEAHARLAERATPHEAHRIASEVWIERKNFAKAHEEARLAWSEGREKPGSLMLEGRIAHAEGNFDKAIKLFDSAIALVKPARPIPKLNFFRGDTLARLGRADEAEQAFLAEIKNFPNDPQTYKNLILLYVTEGKRQDATNTIFSLEKASPTPPSYVAISEVLKTIGDMRGSHFWAARGLNKYPADRQLQSLVRG